jgi:phosphoglycolate phosphatase
MPALVVDGEGLRVKLVLFDLDGTLVDDVDRYKSLAALRFDSLVTRAGRAAAEAWAPLGGYDPKQKVIDMTGAIAKASRREDMAIAAAAIFITGISWHEARKLAEQAYADADIIQMRDYTPRLFPGTEAGLRRVKKAGFSLGIATNGPTAITEELLKILKVRDLFDVVAGSEDTPNPKPSPDLLLLACKRVGVNPSDAVYVGDQPVDAEAAEVAGFAASIIVGPEKVKVTRGVHRLLSVADLVAHP